MPALSGAAIAGSGDIAVDKVNGDGVRRRGRRLGRADVASVEVEHAQAAISPARATSTPPARPADAEYSIAGSGDSTPAQLASAGRSRSRSPGRAMSRAHATGTANINIMGSGDVDRHRRRQVHDQQDGLGQTSIALKPAVNHKRGRCAPCASSPLLIARLALIAGAGRGRDPQFRRFRASTEVRVEGPYQGQAWQPASRPSPGPAGRPRRSIGSRRRSRDGPWSSGPTNRPGAAIRARTTARSRSSIGTHDLIAACADRRRAALAIDRVKAFEFDLTVAGRGNRRHRLRPTVDQTEGRGGRQRRRHACRQGAPADRDRARHVDARRGRPDGQGRDDRGAEARPRSRANVTNSVNVDGSGSRQRRARPASPPARSRLTGAGERHRLPHRPLVEARGSASTPDRKFHNAPASSSPAATASALLGLGQAVEQVAAHRAMLDIGAFVDAEEAQRRLVG